MLLKLLFLWVQINALSTQLNILTYSIRLVDLPQALARVGVLCAIDYHKNSPHRRGWVAYSTDVTFYMPVGVLV